MANHITYFLTIIPVAWPSVCHLFFRLTETSFALLTTPFFSMTAATHFINIHPFLYSPRAHVTMVDQKCDYKSVPYSICLSHHSSLSHSRYIKPSCRSTDEHRSRKAQASTQQQQCQLPGGPWRKKENKYTRVSGYLKMKNIMLEIWNEKELDRRGGIYVSSCMFLQRLFSSSLPPSFLLPFFSFSLDGMDEIALVTLIFVLFYFTPLHNTPTPVSTLV